MANVIQGGTGDDNLIGSNDADVIHGDAGQDYIQGMAGDDTLSGDAGRDTLDGGAGQDTCLFGRGDGQDTIVAGNTQPDRIQFGAGITLADLDVSVQDGGLLLRIKGGHDSVWLSEYINTLPEDRPVIRFADGSQMDSEAVNRKLYTFDDVLSGTPDGDVLDGGLGNDRLTGLGGDDVLYGDAGNDLLDGGAGADRFLFGRGDARDTIMAGGTDSIGDQIVLAGDINVTDVDLQVDGNDLLVRLQNSVDVLRVAGYFAAASPQERPTLRFANGAVWDGTAVDGKVWPDGGRNLMGTAGNDLLDGSALQDYLEGKEGDDTLYGDRGRDVMDGGPGADTYLFGRGDGQDIVIADVGAGAGSGRPDKLQLGVGITMADVAVAQEMNDLVLRLKGSADSVRVVGYFGAAEADRLQIVFTDGATWDAQAIGRKLTNTDDFIGGALKQTTLDGGLGQDNLMGTDGDDTLYGDAGNDVMDGREGSDTYLFGRGDGQDLIINGPTNGVADQPDRLRFAAGIGMADVDVTRDGDMLVLRLQGCDDQVRVPGYFGAPAWARMLIQFDDGSSWDGQAIGRMLDAAADLVYGTPDNDALNGGLGDDVVAGMDGDDTLYGDAGNDRLFGGMGLDTYLFGRGDGRDAIQGGAELAGDQVVLAGSVNVTDVDVRNEGSDLVLSIQGGTDSLRITGYLDLAPEDRPSIRFANGAVWRTGEVFRKLFDFGQDVYAKPGSNVLEGGRGNDHLFGDGQDNVLYGDGGNDVMDGMSGADTYLFGRGDGHDTVISGSPDGLAQTDRLLFGARISIADIAVQRVDNDLLVSLIGGSTDSVRIASYFSVSEPYRMAIQFADGSNCDAWAINRKLNPGNDGGVFNQPGSNTLDGGLGDDVIQGTPGDDNLYGDTGNDWLEGGPGVDTYWFGLGDGQDTIGGAWSGSPNLPDRLRFGTGITLADVAVSQQGDDLLLSLAGGSDSVRLTGYFMPYEPERMRIQFADGTSLDAQSVSRRLSSGNTEFNGTAGNDLLVGGLGSDNLYGQDGDDTLYGSKGGDRLEGGHGSDTYLFGRGDGADVLVLDSGNASPDQDVLQWGAGITAADVSVSQSAYNNGELLMSLKGSSDIVTVVGYFSGPWSSPLLVRFTDGMVWDYAAIDRKLNTYYPNDVFNGSMADDAYDGGNGDDSLYGQAGHDVLYGGTGNDYLDGGLDADTYLFGLGDGSDTVVAEQGDVLHFGSGLNMTDVAAFRQGNDLALTLKGSADQVRVQGYFDAQPLERMRIEWADGFSWDAEAIERKLKATDDVLIGTAERDALEGGLGNDLLRGLEGNDILSGDEGADLLDGGVGADFMAGGAGDDRYIVDNVGDVIFEKLEADGVLSYDSIDSSVSYTAPDFVEAITLTGSDNINATSNNGGCDLNGNTGNNYLKGGDSLDFIFGDDGADTLEGGGGDDYYYLSDNQDTVIEQAGGGLDQIWAYGNGIKMADNVERLYMKSFLAVSAYGNEGKNYMVGNNRNNTLYGYGGADQLYGLSGDDSFYGGLGNDTLYGASGNDSYYFQRGDGADTIVDTDGTAGNSDKLALQGAISANQVWLTKSASDLVVSIIGTSDKVTISNWFVGATYQVESIVAGGNGKTLRASKVQGLVNAMAAFAPPPLGQTTLTPAYSNALSSVIASSWT